MCNCNSRSVCRVSGCDCNSRLVCRVSGCDCNSRSVFECLAVMSTMIEDAYVTALPGHSAECQTVMTSIKDACVMVPLVGPMFSVSKKAIFRFRFSTFPLHWSILMVFLNTNVIKSN